jgi:hypothetical protein
LIYFYLSQSNVAAVTLNFCNLICYFHKSQTKIINGGKRDDQRKLLLCILTKKKKKNAASVLGTIPQSPDLEEIFNILK